MVEELSENKFQSFIKQGNVVVDFFAEWCMPCLMMAPVIDEMAGKIRKVKFGKVNIDENSELAEKFNVMSIPTLIVFKEGKEVARWTGSLPAEVLEERLKVLI